MDMKSMLQWEAYLQRYSDYVKVITKIFLR